MANAKGTMEKSRVFCSYSSVDRGRVNGLTLLLEALGNQVFIDHRTIKPGSRWEAKLQDGLDEADVLLVYWTKNASRSDWVRKEIEYFHVIFPDRLLIPILGDETPLTELLKKYQHSDFCPLINELLKLKRDLQDQGAKRKQIEKEILNRLREAGIDIEPERRRKLLSLFATSGILGFAAMPAFFLHSMGNRVVESVSQLTWSQVVSLGVAAASGAVICSITSNLPPAREGNSPSETSSFQTPFAGPPPFDVRCAVNDPEPGQVLAESTFSAGTDGWKMVDNGTRQPEHKEDALFGREGKGHVTWRWEAPRKFTGDKSAAYGGILTFEIKQTRTDSGFADDDVLLTGGELTLAIDAGPDPATEWTRYAVPLHECAEWKVSATNRKATAKELRSVLSKITKLTIRGEYRTGDDESYLDSVSIRTGSVSAPN